jgi:hypothetical protein
MADEGNVLGSEVAYQKWARIILLKAESCENKQVAAIKNQRALLTYLARGSQELSGSWTGRRFHGTASHFISFSFTNALAIGYVRALKHDFTRARKDPFENVCSDFDWEVEEVAAGPTRKFARSHFYLHRAIKGKCLGVIMRKECREMSTFIFALHQQC